MVTLDRAALEYEHILVSAGQRGMQIRVPVMALMRLTQARIADISREKTDT
jgi:prolyl-tRNA editing enzyme YbaK/EbsC (Cys-tRNA(Pro) deacylase)